MILHDNKELFEQIILSVSAETGIDSGIIEKDYYVTVFLKSLVAKQPRVIFKGGTSLSKCYKLINRFSEDIDLNLESETRPTESQRRHLKEDIISTINDFNFKLINPEDVKSRYDYNRYLINFPSVFDFSVVKQQLVIETSVFLRAFPSREMIATSFIYDYLHQISRNDIITQFSLEPFKLNVQGVERTFIDKLFAVGDYYLDNRILEHSRHIYDLYKLSDAVEINDSLKELFELVREERSHHAMCLSAQEGINLKQLLQKIIDENAYKNDYNTITANILFEDLPYETAIGALQEIINSDFLN